MLMRANFASLGGSFARSAMRTPRSLYVDWRHQAWTSSLPLAMIIETDKLEHELEAGSTYYDCFRKINLRRTEIAAGVYCIQVVSGIYLVGYTTYFFTLAGLPTNQAFSMGVGFQAVGVVGTLVSWVALVHVGRRKLYNFGLLALTVLLLIIGILDCVPNYKNRPSISWAQASLMLIWNVSKRTLTQRFETLLTCISSSMT